MTNGSGGLPLAALGVGLLLVADRAGWLTRGGVAAALIAGAAIWWGLGVVGLAPLCAFFATSSALTRALRRPDHAPRDRDRDRKGRTASQVAANAGVATVAAVLVAVGAVMGWGDFSAPGGLAATGALAAATADTWASEIGCRIGGRTRLITSRAVVTPGETGGVSFAGTLGGVAGAIAIAGLAWPLIGPPALVPTLAAGVGGMLVDSVAGATLERRFARVDNDVVNWLGTSAGAAVAIALARTLGSA